MDALTVAISSGASLKKERFKNSFKMAFFFGFFQAFMPVLGWKIGKGIIQWIRHFDHWIAFILLAAIGIKMGCESFKEPEQKQEINPFSTNLLILLALATSIDALCVGFSLALLQTPILIASGIIGVITFLLSFIGSFMGKILALLLKNKTELIGGIILIAIGLKILMDHLLGL